MKKALLLSFISLIIVSAGFAGGYTLRSATASENLDSITMIEHIPGASSAGSLGHGGGTCGA